MALDLPQPARIREARAIDQPPDARRSAVPFAPMLPESEGRRKPVSPRDPMERPTKPEGVLDHDPSTVLADDTAAEVAESREFSPDLLLKLLHRDEAQVPLGGLDGGREGDVPREDLVDG